MDQEKYIKLFNYGYFLSKNEPKILEKLLQTSKENENLYGPLMAGHRQNKAELIKANIKKRSLNKEKNEISQENKSQDLGFEY